MRVKQLNVIVLSRFEENDEMFNDFIQTVGYLTSLSVCSRDI